MPDRSPRIPSSQISAFAQAERVLQAGRALPVRTVLRLQQTIGNREVARLLTPRLPPSQTKELPTPAPHLLQRLAAAWGRLSGRSSEAKH
ncbi:hypothetical protein LJR084_003657 [Variovorax sp. LjRoot84]|uniref:hypothetical protein n=1 Tax=Variovorax sp. LjRoot84 TaxID=3342340 RepID=UPI003ECE2E85